MQVLVEQLRQKCLEENMSKLKSSAKAYSVLNQAPKEWELDAHNPCGGERWVPELTHQIETHSPFA